MGGKQQTNSESCYICLRKLYPYLRGKACAPEEPVSSDVVFRARFRNLCCEGFIEVSADSLDVNESVLNNK